MIRTETYMTREDGTVLVRTYSDAGMMIEQEGTGVRYSEAVDPENMGRTYTETDEPIDDELAEDASEAEEILNDLDSV